MKTKELEVASHNISSNGEARRGVTTSATLFDPQIPLHKVVDQTVAVEATTDDTRDLKDSTPWAIPEITAVATLDSILVPVGVTVLSMA